MRLLQLLVSLVAMGVHLTALPAMAQGDYGGLARLSEEILLKELDLERYYLAYWVDAKKEPRWRRLRYFLAQQGTASGFLAQNIITLSQTGKNLNHPDEISQDASNIANNVGIVAGAIGWGSSSVELASNTYTAVKNKLHRRDPATAVDECMLRVKEIDRLLTERQQLMTNCKEGRIREVLAEEGRVLKYLRDWCIADFAEIYSDVKSYQSGNSVFFLLDAAANALICVTFIMSRAAVRHPSLEGASLIASIPADSITMVNAPFSSKVADFLSKHHAKKFYRQLNEKPYDVTPAAEQSLARLEELTKSMDPSTIAHVNSLPIRLAISKTWSSRCVKFVADREADIRHTSKIAAQQNIAGPILGGAFLEQDTADTVAFYKYSKRNEKKANAINFSGSIVSGTSSLLSISLSNWYYIDEIRHKRRLRKLHQEPGELLADRLAAVDRLEKSLKDCHNSN